ncbi:hypothetical protein AKO1_013736 [Acrasis kona]|uniref:Coiled-coil alpha-helical rod protein 1 n=1 Tax=Acrasis kona TaxID=1008807 RepID=A0AAW2ZJR6_9EUKA
MVEPLMFPQYNTDIAPHLPTIPGDNEEYTFNDRTTGTRSPSPHRSTIISVPQGELILKFLQDNRQNKEKRIREKSEKTLPSPPPPIVRSDFVQNQTKVLMHTPSPTRNDYALLQARSQSPTTKMVAQKDKPNVEIETLKQNNKQLNDRIAALTEVIQIQTIEIDNSMDNIPNVGSDDVNLQINLIKNIAEFQLTLFRWREKVYELLVQKTAANFEHAQTVRELNEKIKQGQKVIDRLEYELKISKQQENNLKATVEYLDSTSQFAKNRIEEASDKHREMYSQLSQHQTAYKQICSMLEEFKINIDYGTDFLGECCNKLDAHEKRMSFAGNRIKLLRDLKERQNIKKKAKTIGTNTEQVYNEGLQSVPVGTIDYLQDEVDRLTRERDYLARQRESSDEENRRFIAEETKKIKQMFEIKINAEIQRFREIQTEDKKLQLVFDKEKSDKMIRIEKECEEKVNRLVHDYEQKIASIEHQRAKFHTLLAQASEKLRSFERHSQREMEIVARREHQKDVEAKDRIDGLKKKNKEQEVEISSLKREIDAMRTSMDRFNKAGVGQVIPSVVGDGQQMSSFTQARSNQFVPIERLGKKSEIESMLDKINLSELDQDYL